MNITVTKQPVHVGVASWLKHDQAAQLVPGSAGGNLLVGVSADSATDAWAVGSYVNNATGVEDTLIAHWDGTAWSKVKSSNPSSVNDILSGVSADSATDAWAVGSYVNNATGVEDTLILHWNGTSWSKT